MILITSLTQTLRLSVIVIEVEIEIEIKWKNVVVNNDIIFNRGLLLILRFKMFVIAGQKSSMSK
jgi:hypothetical protein